MARRPTEQDPRKVWLSPHFRLSDFLGNHSVYARGLANEFGGGRLTEQKIRNAEALCEAALEPLLMAVGPLSISYGYISPEMSREIVKYQDPDVPSHHRWDLGAAADVVSHLWVQGLTEEHAKAAIDVWSTSPIALAHALDTAEVPYSRMITYSESPYICIAVSDREVASGQVRKAFYENRYMGKPKQKPAYLQLSTPQARARSLRLLKENGLPFHWEGGGFPSYHGGGRKQLQHIRVSKYTMAMDWLFNLKSISQGVKNVPSLAAEQTQDAFAAAGLLYDKLLEDSGALRLSILRGYVSRAHPDHSPDSDWRNGRVVFEVGPPQTLDVGDLMAVALCRLPSYVSLTGTEMGVEVSADVEDVLNDRNFGQSGA